ncbi:ParB-like nuclease domain-containing protein [bacterium]|nr:ParB-like nuclease domain-containing protein [bacterium]
MEKECLTIGGKEIPVERKVLPQAELKFYPENPRIYTIIYSGDEEPSQSEIENRLIEMDHVKQLVQSIKANGGLIDPLIVRDGDYVVFEGNSRLAAYRLLAKADAIKWGKVKCCLIPDNINKDLIFALLGEYHIIGRKDWAPYEQAGYLWRRCKQHDVEPQRISKEMGMSVKLVNHLIEVYNFMLEHKDENIQHFSYYDELIKSRKIKIRREEHKNFDNVIVRKIKTGEIPKAVDIRDKVVKIADVGGKTLKKFLEKPNSLEICYEKAVFRGAENYLYKSIHKFRELICDPSTKKDIMKMPPNQINKCEYELKKIKARVIKLLQLFD